MRLGLMLLLGLLLGLLSACTGESVVRYGPQHWRDTQFVVETRPAPVQSGMNEFIIIATSDDARPGVAFVVSLRIGAAGEWHQAIQDGYSGVYRRAVRVVDPKKDVLNVMVRKSREEAETILHFPLGKPAPVKPE